MLFVEEQNIHSDDAEAIYEIVSAKPSFIVRWGTSILFLVFIFLLLTCWLIQYPDIISATGKVNSINSPQRVIARTAGRIIKISVKENDIVKSGDVLGYIESIANPQSVLMIDKQIDEIISLISQNKIEDAIRVFPQQMNHEFPNDLGELQVDYQTFAQSFVELKGVSKKGFLSQRRNMLITDMHNIHSMHNALEKQKSLLVEDLQLSNKTFEANSVLAGNKVIAQVDFRNEKSKLIAKQLSSEQINTQILLNESLQNEKTKEIADLDNRIKNSVYTFIESVKTIKSRIQLWKQTYLLKAPVSGSVTFTGFLQDKQEISIGQSLFYIQPNNTSYFAEIIIPQYNFGKIKLGQRVLLKFRAYPAEQYGGVVGNIEYINAFPSNSGYTAKISMPNGLMTDRNKTLHFQQGLLIQADVVTENMRFLERLYYDLFRKMNI